MFSVSPYSNKNMRKLTKIEKNDVSSDLDAICDDITGLRQHTNQYLSTLIPGQTAVALDPYYLRVGGAELGKLFAMALAFATKVAQKRGNLKALKIDVDGSTTLFGMPVDQVTRAYLWTPSVAAPNKWTKNKYQQSGDGGISYSDTLLFNIACNLDGTIRAMWAAIINLSSNPNGTGDWKFSVKSKTAGFSSFTLTPEAYKRSTYQQICGDAEMDYGAARDGDARTGMKLNLQHHSSFIL